MFIQGCYQGTLRLKVFNASLLPALQLASMLVSDFNCDVFVLFDLIKLI